MAARVQYLLAIACQFGTSASLKSSGNTPLPREHKKLRLRVIILVSQRDLASSTILTLLPVAPVHPATLDPRWQDLLPHAQLWVVNFYLNEPTGNQALEKYVQFRHDISVEGHRQARGGSPIADQVHIAE